MFKTFKKLFKTKEKEPEESLESYEEKVEAKPAKIEKEKLIIDDVVDFSRAERRRKWRDSWEKFRR